MNHINRSCILTIIIVLSASVFCTGCFFLHGYRNRDAIERNAYRETIDNFFSALDSGDKSAVQSLFSANAQKSDHFDEMLEELMQAYQGPTDREGWDENLQSEESANYGDIDRQISAVFPVVSNGTYFWFLIRTMYENNYDKDQIGINMVYLFSADDYCALKYGETGSLTEDVVISVNMDHDTGCEVRAICGSAYKYTSTPGKKIEEKDVKQFLEKSHGYSEFVKQFGEPDADNIYKCYTLPDENGEPRYLMVGADEKTDTIYDVSVANDFGWIYLLWNDDE